MKTVSLIIPAYNEEEAIPYFLERIAPLLDAEPYAFEMIFIDDGSKDRTLEILLEARRKDPRIRIIELARNFGKELARRPQAAGVGHDVQAHHGRSFL